MLINRPDVPNAYRNARTVLLNALEALGPHRETAILVGGQAIYLHTENKTDINTVEMTTDAELAFDPATIQEPPPLLADALIKANFKRIADDKPGAWHQEIVVPEGTETVSVELDLLVPQAVSGGGKRGGRLGSHGYQAARKAEGLEAALVDRSPHLIRGHTEGDPRSFVIQVAGPAALIVSKMFKIRDRLNDGGDRVKNKDAADVFRLLIATDTNELAATFRRLRDDDLAGSVTVEGIALFDRLCGRERAAAIAMAQEALRTQDDPDVIAARFVALAQDLRTAVG